MPVQQAPADKVEWAGYRLTGQEPLAVRAARKLRAEERLVIALAGTRLRMELDRIPLWRGDHVTVRQLIEDFAQYPYLPRLKEPSVLLAAIRDGVSLMLWANESFAYADRYDEANGRYVGLRAGQLIDVSEDGAAVLVRPDVARRQIEADAARVVVVPGPTGSGVVAPPTSGGGAEPVTGTKPGDTEAPKPIAPRRFHGTVSLDPVFAGRDAGRIAEEGIALSLIHI